MKLGLIGFPVGHSLSPWIHERFLEKAGIKGSYEIMEISPDASFGKELDRMKREGIDGFNVTVPYKKKIMPYLDDLDENASMIGAVNTVVHEDGKWIGYNTDGTGYTAALKGKYPAFFPDKSKRILIIGAGGAAHGIYFGLAKEGFIQIDIANRTADSAKAVAGMGKNETVHTSILSLTEAQEMLEHYDLIIQTTSVGMKPETDKQIISLKSIRNDSIVSDIVYQPIHTAFLQDAEARGASVHYGHTMLLYQAQAAFEHWTKVKVPVGDMDQQLKNILEGR